MIKFGTDGWRALIAEEFTFENVRYVALATARYINNLTDCEASAVVGYDTRFLSKEFAYETARVLAWQGITVHLTDNFATTPQVSFHAKRKSVDLGIIITASHNPPAYNGYKIKANFGGPATPEQIEEVEKYLHRILKRPPKLTMKSFDNYLAAKTIRFFDAKEPYLRHIKKKIDIAAIQEAAYNVLYDPMYGSGLGLLKELLPDTTVIHGEFNPSFANLGRPEPIPHHLEEAIEIMKAGSYDICLATDGDADRLGVIDEDGNFVDSHRVFMILMKYLYEQKKKRGSVVKTVSLTSMVNKFCARHKIKLHETPVGFKYTAKIMSEEKVLIGGEESGGLGTSVHIPERDGIFNGMLLLEVMAAEGKTVKQLCEELDEEFGKHRYERRDITVTPKVKEQILNALEKKPKKLGRFDVLKIDTKDGYKFFVENGWLLIRASGTEPLFRFYAEADSMSKVNELLDEGMKIYQ